MSELSRREFAAMALSATVVPFERRGTSASTAITVQDLLDRIKTQIGVEWSTGSVDGVKVGAPSATVRGVATTSLATLAVLQQAAKGGANIVITGEPAFYAKGDARVPPADPVLGAKTDFVTRHQLVIVRLIDHWRRRQPDPLTQGLARALGWATRQSAAEPRHIDVPPTTLEALVNGVKKRLRSRGGIRVVGDPKMRVTRVGLLPGSTPPQATLTMMPAVDVIVAGEVREWESVEYVRDKVAAGERKALVLVGRIVSEEPGMKACADWLRTFVPEAPIRHLPAGDLYWRPAR